MSLRGLRSRSQQPRPKMDRRDSFHLLLEQQPANLMRSSSEQVVGKVAAAAEESWLAKETSVPKKKVRGRRRPEPSSPERKRHVVDSHRGGDGYDSDITVTASSNGDGATRTDDKLQAMLVDARLAIADKQMTIRSLKDEVEKMRRIFEKVVKMDNARKTSEAAMVNKNPDHDRHSDHHHRHQKGTDIEDGQISFKERQEQLDKGPYNLVFHGLEPDWIEDEMADDLDFKRDVLEQRIRKMIKEEGGTSRDIVLLDAYRYNEGPRIRDAAPVVVSFKSRKDKEIVLMKSKHRLAKLGILITEDSTARMAKMRQVAQRSEK